MRYGAIVESIENPHTFGTVEYSTFGVSIHYWNYDPTLHKKVLTKTLGMSHEDATKFWKEVPLPAWGKVHEHGGVVYDHDHCPVCGGKLHTYSDTLDGHTLCEEHITCTDNKCYHYEFVYGAYAEHIGDKEWYWSYDASHEERKQTGEEVNAEIIRQREAFQRGEKERIGCNSATSEEREQG